ncbi:MAG: glycosyltransferase, partial [Myxococcota bacterium]
NRKTTLRACLETLCRQNLPSGAFKISLVNDGSADGTQEMIDAVSEWPVPVTIHHRDNGGLAAARNTSLQDIGTPLVLFINDDTMAAPDLIHRHIMGHQEQQNIAVLGSFPQPAAEMSKALTRTVENNGLMFCYPLLKTDTMNHPQFFYTCNVSAPTDLVIAAGGFDESFRHYGAEDTDLGLRLGMMGLTVRYMPEAQATHDHVYDFRYVQRRAKMVAKAHIRLWTRHPDLCTTPDLKVGPARQALRENRQRIQGMEAAAETLSAVNLSALEASGQVELARGIEAELGGLLSRLNSLWWLEGLAEGLSAGGHESMAAMLAESPMEIPEARRSSWLLVPTQDALEVWTQRVLQYAQSFREDDPVTLVVLAGADNGYTVDALVETLKMFNDPGMPHIAIIQTGLAAGHDVRVMANVDGWIPTGGAQDARMRGFADLIGVPEIDPAAEQAPWPLASQARTRLLAWPQWSDENELRAMITRYASALVDRDNVTLCLRLDPNRDGAIEPAITRLQQLADEMLPAEGELDVLVVEDRIPDDDLPRLGRAVDALLALPSNTDADQLAATLGVPVLRTAEQLRNRLNA